MNNIIVLISYYLYDKLTSQCRFPINTSYEDLVIVCTLQHMLSFLPLSEGKVYHYLKRLRRKYPFDP